MEATEKFLKSGFITVIFLRWSSDTTEVGYRDGAPGRKQPASDDILCGGRRG